MEFGSWLKRLFGRESGKYLPCADSFIPPQVSSQDQSGKDSCPEIDISKIPCVTISLPAKETQQKSTVNPSNSPFSLDRGDCDLFRVDSGNNWTFTCQQKLPKDKRPDPGFDHMLPFNKGFFSYNRSGKAEGFVGAEAVVQVVNHTGGVTVKRALDHDLLRLSSHAEGSILSDLSFYAILRAYDTDIKLLWCMTLTEMPEIEKRGRELGLRDNEIYR